MSSIQSTGAAPQAATEGESRARLAERKKAMASSFIGSTVEYYDFLLYASAAGLVFPQLFFSDVPRSLGVALSFVILLAGYISRPIGSLLFGHFGDKYGRKNVLVITLVTMGGVSAAIGLLPSNSSIGIAAPIILVFLRVIQGIAVGGEWAGATLLSMEHAAEGKKGLGASIAVAGGPAGAILSSSVLAFFSSVSGENFANAERYFATDWGWRIPFLFSVLLVVIGLYLRTQVRESPEFLEARKAGNVHTGVPLVRLLKEAPKVVFFGVFVGIGGLTMQGLQGSFLIPHMVASSSLGDGAITASESLITLTFASFITMALVPYLAHVSDRLGRVKVLVAGGVVSVVGVWLVFPMLGSGVPLLVYGGFFVFVAILQPAQYAPVGAFLSERFAPEMRYTGAGITFQLSTILGAGLAPLIANRLVSPGESLTALAIYVTCVFIVATGAILLMPRKVYRGSRETVEAAVVQR